MQEYEDIIRSETEKSRMTKFLTVSNDTYDYAILPLERRMTHKFRNAVADALLYMLEEELKNSNVILLPEAKAFLLTTFADKTGLTVVPIRKRDYRIPDQITIEQKKAYKGAADMFCVGLERGDRPLLVEDTISSGGTAMAVESAMRRSGFPLVGIGTLYARGDGVENILKKTGYVAKAYARFEVLDNMPRITSFYRRL
ncbi:MAG: hypothetical protein V1836_01330 [Candidatus Aenigmatarchaeota archaeon]